MKHVVLMIMQVPERIRQQYGDGVRAAFPGLDVRIVNDPDEAAPHLAEATVIVTHGPYLGTQADEVFRRAGRLQWVQGIGVGVDNIVDRPGLRPGVLVTRIAGTQGVPMTELSLSLMLALARQLPRTVRNQQAHRWERWPSKLLNGKTLGILGVGAIAETLAPACRALGMAVTGIGSRAEVPGFDRMVPRERLLDVVPGLDWLLLLVPYSADTHHLVDARVLAAMKPGAFLVNVARGGVLDEAALLQALRERRIAGAALDVFAEEPLPATHDFWDLDNLIVTCHQGVVHEDVARVNVPIICDNLRRFLAGDTAGMRGIVRSGA